MSQTLAFNVVDAFVISGKVFTGNPAAVIILKNDTDIADELKQKIAAEFNLSETAFVSKLDGDEKSDTRLIRWFTPIKEIPLCGHATLATSFVLFKQNPQESLINYVTRYGLNLDCRREVDGQLTLNFPLNAPFQLSPSMNNQWLPRLTEAVLGPDLAKKVIDYQLTDKIMKLTLRLPDDLPDDVLQSIDPDYNEMKSIKDGCKVLGVAVTQKSDFAKTGLHFRSRYFAPWAGINEDPVTGSSFTFLTPYWSDVYRKAGDSVSTFQAKQDSPRGGLVRSRIEGERVFISGTAVEFSTGSIRF